jgi:hypothetical protein
MGTPETKNKTVFTRKKILPEALLKDCPDKSKTRA